MRDKDQRHEHPSTYFVQDRSSKEELRRLALQDQMVTESQGGVLSEQSDPGRFRHVLDVGCGTGGWLIEVAKTLPTSEVLIGVDVSSKLVAYARGQAAKEQVDNRVEFHVGDALRMLEFPDAFFDLVNQRFGQSYVRTWEWSKLVQEYRRVSQPEGVIRITEGEWMAQNTSPALTRLFALALTAFSRAGHSFTPESDGVTKHLVPLLDRHGIGQIQQRSLVLDYCAGTLEGQAFVENLRLAFRTIVPFLHKWTQVPDDYEYLYQQALIEMQQPDFVASSRLLTVWGTMGPF